MGYFLHTENGTFFEINPPSKYELPLKPDLKPQRYQRCFLDRCRHRGGPLRRRVAPLHTVAHRLYLVIFQVRAGSDYTVYLLEVG